MEPVYNGHPRAHKKWLFWRGDLLAQVEMYTKAILGPRPLAHPNTQAGKLRVLVMVVN